MQDSIAIRNVTNAYMLVYIRNSCLGMVGQYCTHIIRYTYFGATSDCRCLLPRLCYMYVLSLYFAEDVLQEVTDKDISETLVKRITEEK